jgi:hypothetical protein
MNLGVQGGFKKKIIRKTEKVKITEGILNNSEGFKSQQ